MKTRHPLTLLVTALICFGADSGSAAESTKPTLIVPPFTGDRVHIQYWQPALGAGLSEMIITEIGKLNKFTVLETTELEALKDEIREGEDGWIEESEKVEKGGFAAADFMFTAKVTRFGAKESSTDAGGIARRVGLGKIGIKQTSADVRIDWRLVDASNRKIIKTGSATADKKGTSFNVAGYGTGGGGNIGHNNREFMDSALGKATVEALDLIIAELRPVELPQSGRTRNIAAKEQSAADAAAAELAAQRATIGKVLAAPSKEAIIVSLGKKHGFKDGDQVNLYEAVEIKDENGVVVFTEEKLVGELELKSVQEDRSRAAYAGDLTVKAGWVVKAK